MNIKIEKAIIFLWERRLGILCLATIIAFLLLFFNLANRISVLELAFDEKVIEVELQFEWLTGAAQTADIQLLNRIKELKEAVEELLQLLFPKRGFYK